ncbi:hypothetical protein G6F50_014605 [Rhizopus delemar]|uniref:Uncharacterized protein n=1 Tax=Rhizopus delemar TaxID=936053 RepID=A0A9P7C756_9FUNG|nr:hypothetical protein G6F50_014605 [Rhizopus delemar]
MVRTMHPTCISNAGPAKARWPIPQPDPAMSFAASTALRPEPFVPVSVPVDDRVHAERGEFAAVLSMRHAGPSPVRLRYEWVGPANAPVVVLAGGISAHRHVASNPQFSEKGWAEDLMARWTFRSIPPTRPMRWHCCWIISASAR